MEDSILLTFLIHFDSCLKATCRFSERKRCGQLGLNMKLLEKEVVQVSEYVN